jgi:CBS domain-containing protein
LLSATAVIALARQRSSEADAARVAPIDEQQSGYYAVEEAIEPVGTAARQLVLFRSGVAWWALGLLAVAVVAASIWYLVARYERRCDERLHQYRRPRALRPPARIVARRRQIVTALSHPSHNPRGRLTIGDLMTEGSLVSSPNSSIATLANLLLSGPRRQVLICDTNGRLLGIVTDRDLRHRRGKRARDVMTQNPTCLPPTAPLGLAAALMVDNGISCLAVVDEGRVRGVLTSDDLALALDCLLRVHETPAARTASSADESAVLSDVQTLCEAVHPDDTSSWEAASRPPIETSS